MKKTIPFIALAFFGVLATSCGSSAISEKDIFAISYNLSDPNMSGLWKSGLEKASVENGFNKISFADAKNDDAEALKMVEAAATKNYGGYLINVVDQDNGLQYVNALKDTKKPVVFFNREIKKEAIDSYDKAYYVGIESAEGGRYQGAMAGEYVNATGFESLDRNKDGKLGVIVVRGEKGHADAEARTQFSPAYLERTITGGNTNAALKAVTGGKYEVDTEKGAWNKVEVISIVDGTDTAGTSWEPVTAATEVGRVLSGEDGNKVDLVLSNNDGMALGIITNEAFQKAGIPIWGVDALDDALTEIKKDNTQFKGTVQNDGRTQAAVCVKAVKNLNDSKAIADGLTVVSTKEAWEADPKAVWNDTATKSLRVHHAKITKDSLK
ncbi:MAG: substrate-binding domain-containing protein [Mollicutes bacterium]|nr:substrate-binding domain-containing protein [Mollicutes bacterium]MDD7263763.1 substrate-binding domain-containing protein [bacterium]MDY4979608.1 substrate-binding domain-containing protein [Candidatus Onthovivens sp.]